MCVATAMDKTIAEDVLKRLNVLEYFSVILICSEVGCNKETPGIYRQSLEYLGTDKCKTIVFEDALHAVITAKNDGFKVAAVYDASESEFTFVIMVNRNIGRFLVFRNGKKIVFLVCNKISASLF